MKAICPICGNEFEKNSNNQKYCDVFCYKKKTKEYQKEYAKSDKFKKSLKKYRQSDKYIENQRKYEKKIMTTLSDRYIKCKLLMYDAPKELIEAKREQLKLYRLIKQMS